MHPQFPADAAVFIAAPWRFVKGRIVAVNPGNSSADFLNDTHCAGHITGKYGASQAVIRIVCQSNGFRFRFECLYGDNRPENFLTYNLHVRRAVVENGRAHKEPIGTVPFGVAFAAADQSGTFRNAASNIAQHLFHIFLRNQGAHVRIHQAIADGHGIRFLSKPPDKFVLDGFLNNNPGTGRADLALVKENTDHCPFHGTFQVGIRKNYIGGFAAQLQADFLNISSSRAHQALSNPSAASKGDHVDIEIVSHFCADFSIALQQVDTAFRQASLFHQFKQPDGGKGRFGTGLKDNAVACRQRRGHLPDRH